MEIPVLEITSSDCNPGIRDWEIRNPGIPFWD